MTIGGDRVRIDFNLHQNADVHFIKKNTAELIDFMEGTKTLIDTPESRRCAAMAQTAYEQAAMWAVKAVT